MQLRRRILKGLLASLALAAVAGVLAVLLPARDVMVRVMLTGLSTAGAAGLMIAMTFLLGTTRGRRAGLFGLAAVIVEFMLCLAAIWGSTWLSSRTEEKIGLSILFVGLCGVPMIAWLVLGRTPRAAVGAAAAVVSTAAAFVIFMVAIWLPGNIWNHEDWWETGWTVGGYGLIVLVCLVGAGEGSTPRRAWRWVGAAAAIAGAAIVIATSWRLGMLVSSAELPERLISIFTSAALVIGFVNLVLMPPLQGPQGWVRIGTIAAGALTALLIDFLVFVGGPFDLIERVIAASGIVTACGSLALIVLVALNRRGAIDPSAETPMEMTVVCPVCRLKQEVSCGRSACARCGLRMEIRLEEPRCPECDYLLYKLASDRCPECGAGVGRLGGGR